MEMSLVLLTTADFSILCKNFKNVNKTRQLIVKKVLTTYVGFGKNIL